MTTTDDANKDILLAERQTEINRLAHRIDQLMAERSHHAEVVALQREVGDSLKAIQRLEFAIWGVTGDNGLHSRVADLQQTMDSMRDHELEQLQRMIKDIRTSVRNWVLGVTPVLVAILGVAVTLLTQH